MMGLKTNPQTVGTTMGCWSCGSGISLVAKEKRSLARGWWQPPMLMGDVELK